MREEEEEEAVLMRPKQLNVGANSVVGVFFRIVNVQRSLMTFEEVAKLYVELKRQVEAQDAADVESNEGRDRDIDVVGIGIESIGSFHEMQRMDEVSKAVAEKWHEGALDALHRFFDGQGGHGFDFGLDDSLSGHMGGNSSSNLNNRDAAAANAIAPKTLAMATLHTALLHASFGHEGEAARALAEAMRVAQEAIDNECLTTALYWHLRLKVTGDRVWPSSQRYLLARCVDHCRRLGMSRYLVMASAALVANDTAALGPAEAQSFAQYCYSTIITATTQANTLDVRLNLAATEMWKSSAYGLPGRVTSVYASEAIQHYESLSNQERAMLDQTEWRDVIGQRDIASAADSCLKGRFQDCVANLRGKTSSDALEAGASAVVLLASAIGRDDAAEWALDGIHGCNLACLHAMSLRLAGRYHESSVVLDRVDTEHLKNDSVSSARILIAKAETALAAGLSSDALMFATCASAIAEKTADVTRAEAGLITARVLLELKHWEAGLKLLYAAKPLILGSGIVVRIAEMYTALCRGLGCRRQAGDALAMTESDAKKSLEWLNIYAVRAIEHWEVARNHFEAGETCLVVAEAFQQFDRAEEVRKWTSLSKEHCFKAEHISVAGETVDPCQYVTVETTCDMIESLLTILEAN